MLSSGGRKPYLLYQRAESKSAVRGVYLIIEPRHCASTIEAGAVDMQARTVR